MNCYNIPPKFQWHTKLQSLGIYPP